MTVIPGAIAGANVSITCGNGHTNAVALSSLAHPPGNFSLITATCPTCGETSTHPITGGAAPSDVQALFLGLVAALGCPCGVLTAGKAAALVRAHLRTHTQALGGVFSA